ncbi:hypothetical protein F0U44_13275 [Nocardioides humilatus]|uniref:Uncharacterized protein n=1 Tax=Nocardioides humilatus TaxID=2607660 RepID=A0A5B1LF77_9ACTN|nr:hypothetical protein [Nocardioides humilatus]KAA1419401.1 hypothetical protein F0U44_13275 [Nocardioides humilatus]
MTVEGPRHRGTPDEPISLSRRRLIVGAGTAAAIATVAARSGIRFDEAPQGTWTAADWTTDLQGADDYIIVTRAEDAMVLRFRFYNMALFLPSSGEPYLSVQNTEHDVFLVVDFPPQSVGEQTFNTTSTATDSYDPVVAGADDVAGSRSRAFLTNIETRLVFQVPDDVPTLRPALGGNSTRPGLLDWHLFHQLTTDGITEDNVETYRGPVDLETSIGAPYGIALSPTYVDGWKHSIDPKTLDGRTELWSTRLAAVVDKDDAAIPLSEYPVGAPKVNAVWSNGFDYDIPNPADLPSDTNDFQVPLSVADRQAIVRLTSDHNTAGSTPSPVEARRLMLTSAGASLELHGAWTPPAEVFPVPPGQEDDKPKGSGINVGSWIHHASIGRDTHVIVTYLGYLLPFGHPAVLIKETQRRFEANPTGVPVAYLRTRRYIVIRKHDKHYGTDSTTRHMQYDARNFPFRRVRINTHTTPNLTFQRFRTPDDTEVVGGAAFCVAGGTPYPFSLTAWDWAGDPVSFTMPLAFVTVSAAYANTGINYPGPLNGDELGNEMGAMPVIRDAYNHIPEGSPLTTPKLDGHRIAVAASNRPGDTTLRFESMNFGMISPAAVPAGTSFQKLDQPRGNPRMMSAQALIPAVQAITPGATSRVLFDADYVAYGFGAGSPDAQSVFLKVDGQPLRFAQGAEGAEGAAVAGTHPGIFTPDMSVGGISRNRGAVGGPTDLEHNDGGVDRFKNNEFVPAAFFDGAKLLGGIPLASLINGGAGRLDKTPVLKTEQTFKDVGGQPDLAQPTLKTTLDWTLDNTHAVWDLVPAPDATHPVFQPRPATTLSLHATFVTPGDGSPPTSDVLGSLRNFDLIMFGGTPFLTLDFREFSFHARNGSKPTVNCDIANVTFGSELSFLRTLQDFLTFGDNGPSIVLAPTSVTAGITLALPSIPIGVFSLSNLSFRAAVEIPFTGAPARLRFSFASRERPFHVAVMIFSGGGWVDLAVGSDGVERLEIGLEFGGQFELDLFVASAGIEVMAGVYLAIGSGESGDDSQSVELTGYLKAHGELNIGPVGASFTFSMGLTYENNSAETSPVVWGEVEVSVEVHCFFISGSVDFHFERTFAGGGDPTFSDMLSDTDYETYAGAFA